jgi:hypothetical protein
MVEESGELVRAQVSNTQSPETNHETLQEEEEKDEQEEEESKTVSLIK